jgi:hypothetical protein
MVPAPETPRFWDEVGAKIVPWAVAVSEECPTVVAAQCAARRLGMGRLTSTGCG